jgi:hypothetical protein
MVCGHDPFATGVDSDDEEAEASCAQFMPSIGANDDARSQRATSGATVQPASKDSAAGAAIASYASGAEAGFNAAALEEELGRLAAAFDCGSEEPPARWVPLCSTFGSTQKTIV